VTHGPDEDSGQELSLSSRSGRIFPSNAARRRTATTGGRHAMLPGMGETIVVGYNGEKQSEVALDRAIETVQQTSGLVIVVVAEEIPPVSYEPTTSFGGTYDATMFEVAGPVTMPDPDQPLPGVQEMIDRAQQRLDAGGVAGEAIWAIGDPAQVILDTARDRKATKIIVGSHHHGFFARLVSDDIEAEVKRYADCEVIVVE
jgi:nucleotide-binding universal stress UspA family protein